MPAKKLLLITYYWPPAGGVAVLRWLHMTNYLAKLGWQITVYHPQNAAFPSVDDAGEDLIHPLVKQISQPIIEPAKIYEAINPKQKSNNTQIFKDNKGWFKTAALRLRANQFIPDARMLWISPSVKFLSKHLRQNKYDVVITNGTPHTCHVIGLKLKQKFPELNWVADFRDPWLEIDYFEDLPLSKAARQKHQEMEEQVITTANAVTTVSPSWANLFAEKGAKQTAVFTNGYPESLAVTAQYRVSNKPIVISHVGTLDGDRNPSQLWRALKNQEEEELTVKLIGPIAEEVQQQTQQLPTVTIDARTIPHAQAIDCMKNSDALLLLNNRKGAVKGRIPAKLFEYLALKKPIIYFGQMDNDAADILRQSGMAKFYEYEEEINLQELRDWLAQPRQPNEQLIAQFSRKHIAEQYSVFLTKLLAQ